MPVLIFRQAVWGGDHELSLQPICGIVLCSAACEYGRLQPVLDKRRIRLHQFRLAGPTPAAGRMIDGDRHDSTAWYAKGLGGGALKLHMGGAKFFTDFLRLSGRAYPCSKRLLSLGDIVQLTNQQGAAAHTMIVSNLNRGECLLSYHSKIAGRPLSKVAAIEVRYGRCARPPLPLVGYYVAREAVPEHWGDKRNQPTGRGGPYNDRIEPQSRRVPTFLSQQGSQGHSAVASRRADHRKHGILEGNGRVSAHTFGREVEQFTPPPG